MRRGRVSLEVGKGKECRVVCNALSLTALSSGLDYDL